MSVLRKVYEWIPATIGAILLIVFLEGYEVIKYQSSIWFLSLIFFVVLIGVWLFFCVWAGTGFSIDNAESDKEVRELLRPFKVMNIFFVLYLIYWLFLCVFRFDEIYESLSGWLLIGFVGAPVLFSLGIVFSNWKKYI